MEKKYLDNLKRLAHIKSVSHEKLGHVLNKDRSVITKKLNGHIPTTVHEYLALSSYLDADLYSLLTAESENDLQEIAMTGLIRVVDHRTEIPELLSRLQKRYAEHIPDEKKQVFEYLIQQLIDLFPPNSPTRK